jgi:CobQ-like glutamine amidotransferase family enzyme
VTTAILQLFPQHFDVNGDAQNALVLAQRARWSGIDVDLVPVPLGAPVPAKAPAVVVIGSSVDSDLPALRVALTPWRSALEEWVSDGVPLLAVGTGYELLSGGVASDVEGLHILPGIAEPLERRSTEDLVVDSEWGRLIGYENHARGIAFPADARALGTVLRGTGNDGRTEGARVGNAIGTHLHGPVLAKNPAVADAMLRAAFGERYTNEDPRIRFMDDVARAAREAIEERLGLG